MALGSVLVLSYSTAYSGPPFGTFTFSSATRASAQSGMPVAATGILLDLLEGYYRVKDGLAADDAAKTIAAITPFSRTVGRIDTFILNSSSGYYKLWPARDSLRDAAAAMQALTGKADLNALRSHFSTASSALYSILRSVNLRGATVYRFYDAAAFNDSGAYWLSYSPQIRNPYFGRKMPEWGELVDTLR